MHMKSSSIMTVHFDWTSFAWFAFARTVYA
jgi:hypothetical protein